MAKQIFFHEEARDMLKRGADAVADAVKITIGPRGRNVVLDKGYGTPTITNDGVSIAKEITLSDKTENMGAEIMKEVASKTNDFAGDGTSTAVILAQAMIEEGSRRTTMGVNSMGVRMGIEAGGHEIVEALKTIAKPIRGKDDIRQVATISAESEELGKIIAETINKVGKDGVVTVEESQSLGIESEVVEGMQFDKGYLSAYMVTNSERMEAEYENPSILLTDKKISSVKEILPFLEKVAESGKKDLVVVADDIEGEALATFVLNKLRGSFNVLALKAPGYGDRKKEYLEDIAIMTGGTVVSEEVGMNFENIELDVLGSARKIIATKENTTIVGGKGKKTAITSRTAQLKKMLENSDSKFDKEKLEERIAKFSGGVAVIRVGAATETEMKYLKLKVEDSVNATKAAIEEGVVPGGGVALVKAGAIASKKQIKAPMASFETEFQVGLDIVFRSVSAPLKQIVENAGKENGAVIADKVKNSKTSAGYDAAKDAFIDDMLKAGIIDPVKVTRSGMQNAASAAAIFLTTEAAVVEKPEKKESGGEGGGMPGGGMPGGMGGMF
jgi:chaperonin GroEL